MQDAIDDGDLSLATKLLEAGEIYPIMLHHAVFVNNIEMVQLFLDHGADVNRLDEYNHTAVMWAFEYLHKDHEGNRWNIINLLVDHGTDLTIPDRNGITAFHLAVMSYNCDCDFIKKIIPLIDVNIIRSTCLADVVNLNIIKLLVEHGFNIYSTNPKGSILHRGSRYSSIDKVEWGLEQGLPINQQNDKGYTPLYLAVVKQKDINMVKYLLKHGADANIPNNKGIAKRCEYPVQFVLRNFDKKMGKLLLKYGANPDLISEDFQTLFYTEEIREFIEKHRVDTIKEPEYS